jgi:DNA-binding NarL/FixJ family response regulator
MLRSSHASDGAPSSSRDISVRVTLADARAGLRNALRGLMESEDDRQVIGEAADLRSTLRLIRAERPHVLVLDLRLRDGSGLAGIEDLRRRFPATEIVVITMHARLNFAERAAQAGALGLVLKDSAETELGEAVRRAAHGEPYVSPRVS